MELNFDFDVSFDNMQMRERAGEFESTLSYMTNKGIIFESLAGYIVQ
jgi:hypothetical protein